MASSGWVAAMTNNNGEILRGQINRLTILIDGDKTLDIRGLRERMDDAEDVINEIRSFKQLLRGVTIGLGLNILGLAGVLAKLLGLFGGP